MKYCPCCGEGNEYPVGFCCDCSIPLVDEPPSSLPLCECDEEPVGNIITVRYWEESLYGAPEAIERVADLTGYKGAMLQVYLEKTIAFNRQ